MYGNGQKPENCPADPLSQTVCSTLQANDKETHVAQQGNDELVVCRDVSKTYGAAGQHVQALRNVNLTVARAECVAVMGRSGSGKTTLINLLTGIDAPSSGAIIVNGHPVHGMSQEELAAWRGRTVGVVFQFFQLLPTLTVVENVMLPMDFCDTFPRAERRARAMLLLERLGIPEQAAKRPADLSGGQQQRAAIARALANDPPLLVADEPTGNLDSTTAHAVMTLLASLASDGKTVLTVTHDREMDRYFTRTIALADGVVVSDSRIALVA